jgi:small subunit ribosomal protein S13
VARIAGVDLPKNKRIEIALTYIYGIARPTAREVLNEAKVSYDIRAKDLADDQIARIRDVIDKKHKVEGDLRRDIALNIKRLMEIASYRGFRHKVGLPVRGQRTHTNSRTRKGPRKGIGGRKVK